MRSLRCFKVLLMLVFVLCLTVRTFAQGTSQVSGAVTDPTGASIPDAQVQITNTDTNAKRTTQTNAKGEYTFSALPIGPYRLEVKKDGFTTYVQSGIILQLDTNPTIPVALKIGNVSEEVNVTANASMVETQSTGVNQVINPQQVVDLPLNGRQATDLVALSGAAVNTNGAGGAINSLDYPNAVSYSVAGSQPNATNYYLDGAQHLDFRTNVGLPLPFPDALSEFNLGISAMPANLGVHPGGSVNAVTRPGTNAWHGNVFDFVRNGVMDATARTYASTTGVVPPGVRDTLVRNQYGGTLGGPIRRDKLFFFVGYQGTTQSSTTGAATTTNIPTAAMRAGDFSAALAKGSGCSIAGQTINSAYTTAPGSNIILPSLLQTTSALVAANINALVPTSGNYDICGDYTYTALPVKVQENQFVGRFDWQRNAKDAIFVRYFLANYSSPSAYTKGNLFSSSGVGLADQIQTLAIGDTYVVGAHGINTVRASFTRTATVRSSNSDIPTICQLGMNATCPIANFLNGAIPKTTPGFLGYDYENSYGISEGYAWSNGKHQLNAGVNLLFIQMNGNGTFQMNPGPTYNGGYTGVTMADYVTGNADAYGQGNGQLSRDGQKQPSIYVQDAWKVKPNFQITGGLRWDPYIPQHNKYGQSSDFTLGGYIAGTISKQFVNAPPGITFPGDAGFNGNSDTNASYKAFAPRAGFVWDMTGNGKETLRGGYGFFYDTSVLWNTMHVVLNPPWGETLSFQPLSVAQGGGLANPFAGANGPNPFPTPLHPSPDFVFPVNGTYIFENQNNKPTYVQQWNLAFQRQISSNLLFSATYIGNKTTHVWLGVSQNASQYLSQYGTTGPCTLPYGGGTYTFAVCNSPSGKNAKDTTGTVTNVNARRALTLLRPQYGPTLAGGLISSFSLGDGSYNGLLVSVEKRMSNHFSVLTNYTWSHCLDHGEIGQDIGNSFQDPSHPKSNWGNCGYNRKGIFNLSLVAQSPRAKNRAVNAFEGGWNGSAIFTASTGSNYNITDNYDVSLSAVGLDRPNLVGDPNQGGLVANNPNCAAPTRVHTLRYWFNPCAFATQTLGTFGNERRNDQVGPANWNLNLALWRRFSLPEHIGLDFRVEAFNALNHSQIGNPTATLTTGGSSPVLVPTPGTPTLSTSTGIITTSSASYQPRILQLAIKASF
jgi:hypothetical protein